MKIKNTRLDEQMPLFCLILFGTIIIIISLFATAHNQTKEEWVCSGYQGANYTNQTLGCKLKECTPLTQDKYPTQIEKCQCENNNLTVYRYCDAWIRTKKLITPTQEIENDILQPNYDELQEEHYQKKQQLNLVPKT